MTAGVLRRAARALLVGLLRLEDDLLQPVTLLVSAAILHRLHRRLHVNQPCICHFYLTARNESTRRRRRTEIPLAAMRIYIVHDLEP